MDRRREVLSAANRAYSQRLRDLAAGAVSDLAPDESATERLAAVLIEADRSHAALLEVAGGVGIVIRDQEPRLVLISRMSEVATSRWGEPAEADVLAAIWGVCDAVERRYVTDASSGQVVIRWIAAMLEAERDRAMAERKADLVTTWMDGRGDRPWTGDVTLTARVSAVTSVGLRRTACLGPCPAYSVVMESSGVATWEGKAFVDRMGAYGATVARAPFIDLAAAMLWLAFDRIAVAESGRETHVLDLPTTSIWIIVAGDRFALKTVGPGSATLATIGKLIDRTAESLSWREISRQEALDPTDAPLAPDGGRRGVSHGEFE